MDLPQTDDLSLLPPPAENTLELPQERPGLLARFGENVANTPSDIINSMMNLYYGLGFRSAEQPAPVSVPKPFDIPAPQTIPETLTDVAATIPTYLTGEAAGAEIATGSGLEKAAALARMLKVGGGFGLQGLTTSPEEGAKQAGVGAAYGAAESALPLPARLAAAGGVGLETYLSNREAGATRTRAGLMAGLMSLLPFATRTKIPPPATPVEEVGSELALRPAGPLVGESPIPEMRPIPGTGGPVPFGGALEESTTRARPIFGTETAGMGGTELPNGPQPALALPSPEAPLLLRARTTPPEGALIRDPIMTQLEARRGAGIQPPEGSLIQEPIMTQQEARRGIGLEGGLTEEPLFTQAEVRRGMGVQPPEGSLIDIGGVPKAGVEPLAAPPTAPPKIKLATIIQHDNEAISQAAADKLGIEYKGIWPGTNHIEFKIPEDAPNAARGANITLESGATFKDLKNTVAERIQRFEDGAALKREGTGDAAVATVQHGAPPESAAAT